MNLKITEFFKHFSQRIKIFLKRERILLVNDKEFEDLLLKILDKEQLLRCEICMEPLTINDISGFTYDQNKKIIVFCNNPNCCEKWEINNDK